MTPTVNRISVVLTLLLAVSAPAAGQLNTLPAELRGIGVNERLAEQLPLDVRMVNEVGDTVALGSYFGDGKPVILVPVYYGCPMLCGLILNGLTDAMKTVAWKPGREYTVVTFSFDHTEGPDLAAAKKRRYIEQFGVPGAENGWHFLTGDSLSIARITESIGFGFRWSDESQEFLHTASIAFISPTGRISRYLYGAQFSELDLRNALFDAADGKIGTVVDRIILYCYTYDPDSRSYVPYAVNIMKLGGLLTLVILGSFLGILWYRERLTFRTA
jgi:protein SCO1/2